MNKGVTLMGGVGLGAALMYIFDPDRGKRRRALLRDKVESAGNTLVEKAGKVRSDLGNRAYDVVAETKSMFRHDEVSDEVLACCLSSRRKLLLLILCHRWLTRAGTHIGN